MNNSKRIISKIHCVNMEGGISQLLWTNASKNSSDYHKVYRMNVASQTWK